MAALAAVGGCPKSGSSSAPAPSPLPPGGPLAITSIAPTQGADTGGTSVTITGSGFTAGGAVDAVEFGSTAGTGLQVLSDTQLVVSSPAGTGIVAVTVRRSWTTNVASEPGAYLYLSGAAPAPTILNVVLNQGPVAGGVTITVNGSGFQSGAAVTFGGAAATNVVVHGSSRITLTLPPGSLGPATVAVTNPDTQGSSISGGFSYVTAPTVASIAPTTSWTTGGALVTVQGSNFAPGMQVSLGGSPLTNLTYVSSSEVTGTTSSHVAGVVTVQATNVGPQSGSLPNAFTYVLNADSQTAAYTFDTAAGIDCRNRWYVNMNDPAFRKDLQNQGLQTWGIAGDNSSPPASPALVDALVLDWVRAYTLSTLNVLFGRNGDGSGVSTTSCNITFVGLQPSTGARGCATPGTDWGEICVGGCDPGSGGPHPIASQVCSVGLLGRATFDNGGSSTCNSYAEQNCNPLYHSCTGCTWPSTVYSQNGVFAGVIGTQWISTLSGGPLNLSDHPYLDGTITSGIRYTDLHAFMQQYAYRLAYVAAHEIGHSSGLVSTSTSGSCSSSTGLCSGGAEHNSCCSTNVMSGSGSLWGTFSQTSRAFSGQPSSVSAASTCSTGGVSSWTLLQSFLGTTP